ncbi:uncharacterized protein K489DRAFT_246404 [Dissoconium aciculare CBS 342.82]|uniref:Uncharacterized protein n=1 Tax=Dissoconium aciculare CBS 342.82 TaxID=1314786 RepID=A0A6J3LZX7_9PEZI|nr:uncharacterized protein K489DRAFT_246404 [Dissoconium aciculare CBS 342.82]KAF1821340.1 hypothetical protein K489DRAFT_246404 [Dissoconium aciculare CBS 342.82]
MDTASSAWRTTHMAVTTKQKPLWEAAKKANGAAFSALSYFDGMCAEDGALWQAEMTTAATKMKNGKWPVGSFIAVYGGWKGDKVGTEAKPCKWKCQPTFEALGVSWYADGTTYEDCTQEPDGEVGNTKRAERFDLFELETSIQSLSIDENSRNYGHKMPTTLQIVGVPAKSDGPVYASPSESTYVASLCSPDQLPRCSAIPRRKKVHTYGQTVLLAILTLRSSSTCPDCAPARPWRIRECYSHWSQTYSPARQRASLIAPKRNSCCESILQNQHQRYVPKRVEQSGIAKSCQLDDT